MNTILKRVFPLLSIGLLFFIFGFITWLNGALIPFLQIICELTEFEALLIAFSFYIAYVFMAMPMALILQVTGYQKGISLGLMIIGVGCLLFIPAALSQTFMIFLFAQFVVGSGLTILQTASNPFVVKLGEYSSAAARIAFMGILNKAAGVIAPLVFTATVVKGFPSKQQLLSEDMTSQNYAIMLSEMSASLIQPYVGMAVVLFALGYVFSRLSLPTPIESEEYPSFEKQTPKAIWDYPHVVLGAMTLFVYVGVEVIAGDTIGLYGSALGVKNATTLTSYTMMAMVIGYCLGLICIPRILSQQTALVLSGVLGLVLTITITQTSEHSLLLTEMIWGWSQLPLLPDPIFLLALLGLANAMVWPSVWPLALNGLGPLTAKGSALLIMGIAGGALLPLLYGSLIDWSDRQAAYWVMLPCYMFITYYAISGYKKRSWRA